MARAPIQAQKFSCVIDYPASKQDLVQTAEKGGADENLLRVPRNVPDRRYDAGAGSREISEAR